MLDMAGEGSPERTYSAELARLEAATDAAIDTPTEAVAWLLLAKSLAYELATDAGSLWLATADGTAVALLEAARRDGPLLVL